MSGQPIFVRVDRNGVHRELMCRAKYADGDFLETEENDIWSYVELMMKSYPAVCDEDLCQGPAVTSRLTSHSLDGVHRRARYTGRGGKDGCEPGGVKCRHGWGPMRNRSRTAMGALYSVGGSKPDRKVQFSALEKK